MSQSISSMRSGTPCWAGNRRAHAVMKVTHALSASLTSLARSRLDHRPFGNQRGRDDASRDDSNQDGGEGIDFRADTKSDRCSRLLIGKGGGRWPSGEGLAMTRSSSDNVKARSQPEMTAGAMTGNVTDF